MRHLPLGFILPPLLCILLGAAPLHAKVCGDIFTSQQSEIQIINSFSSVIEYGIQFNLVTPQRLEQLSSQSIEQAIISTHAIMNSAATVTFKRALLELLNDSKVRDSWSEIKDNVKELLKKNSDEDQKRQTAKETTRLVADPVDHEMSLSSLNVQIGINRRSEWHQLPNGDAVLAVTREFGSLLIFRLSDLDHPTEITGIHTAYQTPSFFTDKGGRTLLAVGSGAQDLEKEKPVLYIYDLNDIQNPKVIPLSAHLATAVSWFTDADGRELFGFSTHATTLNVYDLKNYSSIFTVEGFSTHGPPRFNLNRDGSVQIAVSFAKGNMFVFSLNAPHSRITLNVGDDLLSDPVWYTDPNGKMFLIATTGTTKNSGDFVIFDLTRPKKPLRIEKIAGLSHTTPALYTGPDGVTYAAFASRTTDEIFIVDLTRSKAQARKFHLGLPIKNNSLGSYVELVWHKTADQRVWLSAMTQLGLYVLEMRGAVPQLDTRIRVGTTRFNAAPVWITDTTGASFIAGIEGESIHFIHFYRQSNRE